MLPFSLTFVRRITFSAGADLLPYRPEPMSPGNVLVPATLRTSQPSSGRNVVPNPVNFHEPGRAGMRPYRTEPMSPGNVLVPATLRTSQPSSGRNVLSQPTDIHEPGSDEYYWDQVDDSVYEQVAAGWETPKPEPEPKSHSQRSDGRRSTVRAPHRTASSSSSSSIAARRAGSSKAAVARAHSPRVNATPPTIADQRTASQRSATVRLEKTQKLDALLIATETSCPICLLWKNKVAARHWHKVIFERCLDDDHDIPYKGFLAWRSAIRLPGGCRYCYRCGVPQDNGGAREEPASHGRAHADNAGKQDKGKEGECPWFGLIPQIVWLVTRDEAWRQVAQQAFPDMPDPIGRDADFMKWYVDEDGLAGNYYNGLELAIWAWEVYRTHASRQASSSRRASGSRQAYGSSSRRIQALR